MQSQLPATDETRTQVANYDEDQYDYRDFWAGRDYEHWAETRVLRRLFTRTPRAEWLVDLGGGFGRHIPLYQAHAAHVVLVDYSWTNLANAERALMPHGADGSLFLIRGNLYHLPFRDGAFDLGMTTRVIHHLKAIDEALDEMGRTIGSRWLLDVPIKTHLLARARGLAHGRVRVGRDRGPNAIGTADTPFYNFHLGAIRERLRQLGWSSTIFASVNNFRRWERAVPGRLARPLRPVVHGLEMAAQRVGRGWWGPAQFLWLVRTSPLAARVAVPTALPAGPMALLAPRMMCPACHGDLEWSADAARCVACQGTYGRKGAIWDFVVG
ncbi:MAG: class I SAM-dependent methyltransferase [Ktedonobacterales bacterium]|nr:class I SAM-dependent methyltransferase [Ktedonobacterales bacterium]